MQTQTKIITAHAFAEALTGTWMSPVQRAKRRESYLTLPADILTWIERHAESRRGEILKVANKAP